ncbi:hypothetical protein RDABS01_019203 [Bienertia sinuspersici]
MLTMEAEITPFEKLLPEMWLEIFSKLPAKTLVQLRCVSKSWRSTIDNPNFISMHIARFKNNSNKHFLISFEYCTMAFNEIELRIRVRTMGKFRKREEIMYTLFPAGQYHLEYKGFVDGLILFVRYYARSYDLFLFNPSIRKSMLLPQEPPCPRGRAEIVIGFDPVMKDYKVVMIIFPFRLPDDTTPCSLLVYELRTGVWRANPSIEAPERWLLGQKVFTRGVMHWISFDREADPLPKNNTHIVSFNFSSETFSFTELPGDRSDVHDKITCPFLLGDSLAVLDVSRAYVCIWVMNKCGETGKESWSKWYHGSIGLDTFEVFLEHRYRVKKLTYVESLRRFLLQVNKKMKSFDLKSGKLKDLEPSSHCSYSIDPYVESLLLSKEPSL